VQPTFPSSLHSRAAYETRHRCAGDRAGPVYNTSRPAEACKTACAASHPQKSCAPKTRSLAIGEGLGSPRIGRVAPKSEASVVQILNKKKGSITHGDEVSHCVITSQVLPQVQGGAKCRKRSCRPSRGIKPNYNTRYVQGCILNELLSPRTDAAC